MGTGASADAALPQEVAQAALAKASVEELCVLVQGLPESTQQRLREIVLRTGREKPGDLELQSVVKVFVDSELSGERIAALELPLGTKVDELRTMVQDESASLPSQLMFNGDVLGDGSVDLLTCGVVDGSVLQLAAGREQLSFTLRGTGAPALKSLLEADCFTFSLYISPCTDKEFGVRAKSYDTEVSAFSIEEVLKVVEEKYSSDGSLCGELQGDGDPSRGKLLEFLKSADAAKGFHCDEDDGGYEHDFLVSGHCLRLMKQAERSS